jgi:site-specific DNA recombinase
LARSTQPAPSDADITSPRAGAYLLLLPDESISLSGLDVQRSKASALAHVKGWHIVNEYNDTTSRKEVQDQPALAKLLGDAKAGNIEAVIVWSLDRFGHSIREVLDIVEQLDRAGVALVVWKEGIDTTTPAGQFTLTIFTSLVNIERGSGMQLTQSPVKKRRKTVTGTTGKIPYGYRRVYDPETGALQTVELAPKQAEIVRRIFHLRDSEGLKLEAIAADVGAVGNSPRGAGWTPTAVLRILKNKEKYAGSPRGSSGERWPAILEKKDT